MDPSAPLTGCVCSGDSKYTHPLTVRGCPHNLQAEDFAPQAEKGQFNNMCQRPDLTIPPLWTQSKIPLGLGLWNSAKKGPQSPQLRSPNVSKTPSPPRDPTTNGDRSGAREMLREGGSYSPSCPLSVWPEGISLSFISWPVQKKGGRLGVEGILP